MKNVSIIDIAPLTSLGKFFYKSDSRETTWMIENTTNIETRAYVPLAYGLSIFLNMYAVTARPINAGAIKSRGLM